MHFISIFAKPFWLNLTKSHRNFGDRQFHNILTVRQFQTIFTLGQCHKIFAVQPFHRIFVVVQFQKIFAVRQFHNIFEIRSSSAASQDLYDLAKADFLYQAGFLWKGYI